MALPSQTLIETARWFLESGIQEPCGGVARYYRTDLGRNAPVSTEITGYAVSALLYLHSRTGDSRCLDSAVAAASFLTRTAWDDGLAAFPFELAGRGDSPGLHAYFFDSGIIVRALLAMGRASGDDEYGEIALRCGASMAADFASARGFHPILELPSKHPVPGDARWSRRSGCYQLKAALGWLELAATSGDSGFVALYEQVLECALLDHRAFPEGEAGQDRVMDRLHAYCYFLEGLLPRTCRPDCAAALVEGIGRVSALLETVAPRFERSDVYAQLLRLRLFAAAGLAPLDEAAAEREAATIAGFQASHTDCRLDGGFWFGRKSGELLPYVNPVSAAFGVQALEMYREFRAGTFEPAWQTLI